VTLIVVGFVAQDNVTWASNVTRFSGSGKFQKSTEVHRVFAHLVSVSRETMAGAPPRSASPSSLRRRKRCGPSDIPTPWIEIEVITAKGLLKNGWIRHLEMASARIDVSPCNAGHNIRTMAILSDVSHWPSATAALQN